MEALRKNLSVTAIDKGGGENPRRCRPKSERRPLLGSTQVRHSLISGVAWLYLSLTKIVLSRPGT